MSRCFREIPTGVSRAVAASSMQLELEWNCDKAPLGRAVPPSVLPPKAQTRSGSNGGLLFDDEAALGCEVERAA